MTRQDEMTKFKDNEAMIIVEILGIRNLARVLRIWSVFLPAITSRSPPIVIPHRTASTNVSLLYFARPDSSEAASVRRRSFILGNDPLVHPLANE